MQVGDAAIGIDHRQRGPLGVQRVDVRLDGGLLIGGQFIELRIQIADAVIRLETNRLQSGRMFLEDGRIKDAYAMAEDDGIAHLHHGGFHVQRKEDALLTGLGHFARHELAQRMGAHHAGINHLALEQRQVVLEHRRFTVAFQLNAHRAGRSHYVRLFAAVKIAAVHVRHVAFGIGRPRAHRVRVLLRVRLHRRGHAPIGIALAQHRIHRTAQHLRIPRADILLCIRLRLLRKVRHRKSIRLQLLNRRHQLRDGRADVRQLDDVRLGRLGQLA